jgi:hypothetical protein
VSETPSEEEHVCGPGCAGPLSVSGVLILFGSYRFGGEGFIVRILAEHPATGRRPRATEVDFPDWPSAMVGLDRIMQKMLVEGERSPMPNPRLN